MAGFAEGFVCKNWFSILPFPDKLCFENFIFLYGGKFNALWPQTPSPKNQNP
jgi:hypothetical protein